MATIRRAKVSETALLSELAVRSKAYWGYDAEFMDRCREELTLHEELFLDSTTFVAEVDSKVVGFYTVEATDDGRMELSFLFVEPEAIGQGHGRALLEHAKAFVRAQGATTLEIQSDPHAATFYMAAGGRLVGTRSSASIPGRTLPVFEIDLEP